MGQCHDCARRPTNRHTDQDNGLRRSVTGVFTLYEELDRPVIIHEQQIRGRVTYTLQDIESSLISIPKQDFA